MKIFRLVSFIPLVLALWACNQSAENNNASFSESEQIIQNEDMNIRQSSRGSLSPPNLALDKTKKLIKEGELYLDVQDINKSKKSIDEKVAAVKGYYDEEHTSDYDNEINYQLKVKIPAESFESFIRSLENGTDKMVRKSIRSIDVTAQFIDIEARLENNRSYLKRYRELLSKASSVKDVLSIEEHIRTVQEEIESRERQLKYLTNQVAYSTLSITLSYDKPQSYKRDNYWSQFTKSLSNGWFYLIQFSLFLLSIWPFILVTLGIYYFIKKRKM